MLMRCEFFIVYIDFILMFLAGIHCSYSITKKFSPFPDTGKGNRVSTFISPFIFWFRNPLITV